MAFAGIAPILSAGISGIASLIGGSNQQSANAQSVQQQEQFQSQQQQAAEAYNTQMSDTTYQRTVQSLQQAGLNPMLAMGQSVNSPSVGAMSGSTYQAPNVLGSAANSAISAGQNQAMLDQQLQNLQTSNSLTQAQVAKTKQDTKTGAAQQSLIGANTANVMANTGATLSSSQSSAQAADVGTTSEQFMTDNPALIKLKALLGTGIGPAAQTGSNIASQAHSAGIDAAETLF